MSSKTERTGVVVAVGEGAGADERRCEGKCGENAT